MTTLRFQRCFAAFILATLPLASPGATAPGALDCVGTTWDASGNFLSVFRLTNSSEETTAYSGYAPATPVYKRQIRRLTHWRDEPTGWCGVGLGIQRLTPNHSLTFAVPPPDGDRAWRIGVQFTFTGADSRSKRSEIVWSSAVTSKSPRQIELAAHDASSLVQLGVSWNPDREFPYTFNLTNMSEKTLFYGGYSEPDVPPIYLNEERRMGHWRDDGKADWSGSNFGFKRLRPRDSMTFSIPPQSLDHSWRIGIRLFRTDAPHAPDDACRPVWWAELPPRGKPPKIGAANGDSRFIQR